MGFKVAAKSLLRYQLELNYSYLILREINEASGGITRYNCHRELLSFWNQCSEANRLVVWCLTEICSIWSRVSRFTTGEISSPSKYFRKASADLVPRYSLRNASPYLNSFRVGYLVILNRFASSARTNETFNLLCSEPLDAYKCLTAAAARNAP